MELKMKLNRIYELSMVLDSKKFEKIYSRACEKSEFWEHVDGEDIDLSLESYGVSVVYHDSQYKKKIKLIVNTCSGFHDDFNIYEYIEMVDKRIRKYFDHKYGINDFTLSGMQIFILMDVGTRENVSSYLKVIKRVSKVKGFTSCSYELLFTAPSRN